MENQSKDNKRQKTRVEFQTEIILKIGESEYSASGDSQDLSLGGVFVATDVKAELGTKCDVEIVLTGMTEKFTLKMKGTVVRITESGLGIKFDSVDIDSFTHLKNIVMYNAVNPDEVINEI